MSSPQCKSESPGWIELELHTLEPVMDQEAPIPAPFTNTTPQCSTDLRCGHACFASIPEEPTGKSNQRGPGPIGSSPGSAVREAPLVEWPVALMGVKCPAKDRVIVRSPALQPGGAETNVGTRGL